MRLSISRHWLHGRTSSRKWKCFRVYGQARVSQVWTTSRGARLGRMVSVQTSLMKVKRGVIGQAHSASGHISGSTVRLGETKEMVEGVEGMDWSVVEQDLEPDQAEGVVCVEGDEEQVCDSQEVREPTKANTTFLNPHAPEFCPKPRVPMIYGPEVQRNIQLHSLVKMSGMPNFKGCRVPIKTAINVEIFRSRRPLSFWSLISPLVLRAWFSRQCRRAITGGMDFPQAIDDYVRKECELGATLGPFDHNLLGDFPLALSPLNSVPKSETSDRRIILDLSFPPGRGVNDGIARNMFLGEPYRLRLSGVDDMVDLIHRKGPRCLLFKRDLSRAFRQFAVDPADLDKLEFEWRGKLFLDRVLAMGLRMAGIACQRATNILAFICKQNGVEVLNYLDDLGGTGVEGRAQGSFEFLG